MGIRDHVPHMVYGPRKSMETPATQTDRRDRVMGCLLGGAVGDALAASGDNVYMGGESAGILIPSVRIGAVNTLGVVLPITYKAAQVTLGSGSVPLSLVSTSDAILVQSGAVGTTYGMFMSIRKSDNKVINDKEQL